jgi:Rieske Fe-S protein
MTETHDATPAAPAPPTARCGGCVGHDPAGDEGPARRGPGRRGVLRAAGTAAGLVAGAGVLAACSSSSDTGTGSGAGAGNGAGNGGSGGGGGASATPTSDVPVGGATFFPDTLTIVTQPEAGTFKAFDATCPHQGCAVSQVDGSQLVCPCHGSTFALATGDRISGPATTGLTPKTITVSGSTFTVS